MRTPEQPFFQSITIEGGRQVPIYNLVSGTYTEEIELNGPVLLMSFNDSDSGLADDFGLREGAVIDVRMGDSGSNARAAYFASKFTIISALPDGDHLQLVAIESGVYDIKQPTARTLVYGNQKPAEILGALFPGYRLEIPAEVNTSPVTYHVPAGSLPSIMLRKMAKELGCALWVARGDSPLRPAQEPAGAIPKGRRDQAGVPGQQLQSRWLCHLWVPAHLHQRRSRKEREAPVHDLGHRCRLPGERTQRRVPKGLSSCGQPRCLGRSDLAIHQLHDGRSERVRHLRCRPDSWGADQSDELGVSDR
ncbi:hypothetical protein [Aeromonas hydrophila]|uniref:hypothetical protein n=1 Tax=Aeromonas hydrophila TaxID=644 RepID=UPI00244235C1|nr:hypothetical protein [Aeromonas hydrophila]